MRKILLVLIPLLGAGVFLVLRAAEDKPWTTDSPEALAAFERGLEAQMKLYLFEAKRQYEQALEFDPSFVAARERLVGLLPMGSEASDQLIEELRRTDTRHLSDRERFLIERLLARSDGRSADAERLLDEFGKKHPKDPFGLMTRCTHLGVVGREPEEIERCYQQLVDEKPNWVLAQNQLGYLAMRQGHFEQAEERFLLYQFIAPDQANPHDSMAELLIFRGRYEEAEVELDRAIELRADFLQPYFRLILLGLLRQDPGLVDDAVARAETVPDLPEGTHVELRCHRRAVLAALGVEAQPIAEEGECRYGDVFLTLRHRAALAAGDRAEVEALEQRVRADLDKKSSAKAPPMEDYGLGQGFLLHLEGTRLAFDGNYPAALERLREADGLIGHAQLGEGLLKLRNLLILAETLERSGQAEEAQRVRQRIDELNPRFTEIESIAGLPPSPTASAP